MSLETTAAIMRVEKTRVTANEVDKVSIRLGDAVEIDWKYAVVPGSLPVAASAHCAGNSLQVGGIYHVKCPGTAGGGVLAAFFAAEQLGSSVARFDISVNSFGHVEVINLECHVQVVGP